MKFGSHSVTSPGFETYVPQIAPAQVAKALRDTNPGLVFSDTSQRGYVFLSVTPQDVVGQWHFMSDLRTRTTALSGSHAMRVRKGVKLQGAV